MREGNAPKNLKDILLEANVASELMVRLAYVALVHGSQASSEEVFGLEGHLNSLVSDIRTPMMLCAHSPAGSSAGLFGQELEKLRE